MNKNNAQARKKLIDKVRKQKTLTNAEQKRFLRQAAQNAHIDEEDAEMIREEALKNIEWIKSKTYKNKNLWEVISNFRNTDTIAFINYTIGEFERQFDVSQDAEKLEDRAISDMVLTSWSMLKKLSKDAANGTIKAEQKMSWFGFFIWTQTVVKFWESFEKNKKN